MKKNNKGNFLFLFLCVVGYLIVAAPAQKSYTKSTMIEKDLLPLNLVLDVDDLEKTWDWNLEISFGPVEEQQDLNVDMNFFVPPWLLVFSAFFRIGHHSLYFVFFYYNL